MGQFTQLAGLTADRYGLYIHVPNEERGVLSLREYPSLFYSYNLLYKSCLSLI